MAIKKLADSISAKKRWVKEIKSIANVKYKSGNRKIADNKKTQNNFKAGNCP